MPSEKLNGPVERWEFIAALDEKLLKGGVILSEWCSIIVRDADTAFAAGAHLAAILTAVSGIETYLRSEYADEKRRRLVDLINSASIPEDLRSDLHALRRYRNRWVHVDDPWNDEALIEKPGLMNRELEDMALSAIRTLRRMIYENQWV